MPLSEQQRQILTIEVHARPHIYRTNRGSIAGMEYTCTTPDKKQWSSSNLRALRRNLREVFPAWRVRVVNH